MRPRTILLCIIIMLGKSYVGTIVAQPTNFPAIILIDQTVPRHVDFKCVTSNFDTINVHYNRCCLVVDSATVKTISHLSKADFLAVEMEYQEGPFSKNRGTYHYTMQIPTEVFFSGNLLISITTFNKRKNIYYVHFSGNGWIKAFQYEKSFGSYRKAKRKVFSIFGTEVPN